MENIKWICKANTVNDNIVWMCHQKVKEHFESTSNTALLGTTAFSAGPINITLGPANFGPSSSLCNDTNGYYKMAEYNFIPDWSHPNYDTNTLKSVTGKMWIDGPQYDGQWNGLNFCGTGYVGVNWGVKFSAIDSNGKNFLSTIQDFVKYQEFSAAFSVIIREKNKPTNYYLMPRIKIDCNPYVPTVSLYNTTYEPQADQYRLPVNTAFADLFGFPSETSFNGQSGGTPPPKGSGGLLYEVFIKPFTRPVYPFTAEPSKSAFTNLPADLEAQLIMWFDANDPNGDGSSVDDNTPLKKWMDKSSNNLSVVRCPKGPYDSNNKNNDDINDGDYTTNPGDTDDKGNKINKWKNRLPRLKKNFKNGLSVIRFNGNNGFQRPDGSGPYMDQNWNNFYANGTGQITNQNQLTGHTIFTVSYQTEYGPEDGVILSFGDFRLGSSKDVPAIIGFGMSHLTNDASTYIIENYNTLNKWVITSVVKFKSNQNPSHKIFANGTQVNQNWFTGGNYNPTNRPDLWDFSYIRRWDDRFCIGCNGSNDNNAVAANQGFSGDIAEILAFPVELSDDDRVRVETYLAKKWNLSSQMNIPLPLSDPRLGFPSAGSANNVTLFNTTNFVAPPPPALNPLCVGFVSSMNNGSVQMVYSQDGLTNWQVSPSSSQFGKQFKYCAYNGLMWIACTDVNNPSKSGMFSSTDGINWSPILSNGLAWGLPKEYNAYKICWGNNTWVAIADGGVYASTDGINFFRDRRAYNFTTVVYGNGVFLGCEVNSYEIFMSIDGKKYKSLGKLTGTHQPYGAINDFLYFNNMWVACFSYNVAYGADDIIFTSTDLKTWTAQKSASALLAPTQAYVNGAYSLCSNGKVIIAGINSSGNNNCLIYSNDGVTWQNSNAPTFKSNMCSSTTYNGKYFIANISLSGSSFKTVSSTDGVAWTDSRITLRFNTSGYLSFTASQNVKPFSLILNNTFSPGKYNINNLKSIAPKTLQSMKIPTGLQVILYQNGDFTGKSKLITNDTPDLSKVTDENDPSFIWINQMQSFVVLPYKPLPTNMDGIIPKFGLVSGDPTSFLVNVPNAELSRVDGSYYLFVDPNNRNNTYWYNASELYVLE